MNKNKLAKISTWVMNIVCIILMVFVLTLTISTLIAPKGLSSFVGFGYLTVVSDSMDGDKEDSFNKGDIIYVDILSQKEKISLKEGDIVTFLDTIEGKLQYNSHRIVSILEDADGTLLYATQGDNELNEDAFKKIQDDIVGKYVGQSKGIGKVILWMQSPTGFLFSVILPSALILMYGIYTVIVSLKAYNKSKFADAEQKIRHDISTEMKEQLKEELRIEMQQNDDKKE